MAQNKQRITYDLSKNVVVQSGSTGKSKTDMSDLTDLAETGKKMEVILRNASIVFVTLVLLTMLFLILPDPKSRAIVFTALFILAGYIWYRIKRPYG